MLPYVEAIIHIRSQRVNLRNQVGSKRNDLRFHIRAKRVRLGSKLGDSLIQYLSAIDAYLSC